MEPGQIFFCISAIFCAAIFGFFLGSEIAKSQEYKRRERNRIEERISKIEAHVFFNRTGI